MHSPQGNWLAVIDTPCHASSSRLLYIIQWHMWELEGRGHSRTFSLGGGRGRFVVTCTNSMDDMMHKHGFSGVLGRPEYTEFFSCLLKISCLSILISALMSIFTPSYTSEFVCCLCPLSVLSLDSFISAQPDTGCAKSDYPWAITLTVMWIMIYSIQ